MLKLFSGVGVETILRGDFDTIFWAVKTFFGRDWKYF